MILKERVRKAKKHEPFTDHENLHVSGACVEGTGGTG